MGVPDSSAPWHLRPYKHLLLQPQLHLERHRRPRNCCLLALHRTVLMQHRQMQRWVSLTVQRLALRPYKHLLLTPQLHLERHRRQRNCCTPGPAPDGADATPPDAEVGVPDSSAPGPEAIQAPPADSPVAPGEAPQARGTVVSWPCTGRVLMQHRQMQRWVSLTVQRLALRPYKHLLLTPQLHLERHRSQRKCSPLALHRTVLLQHRQMAKVGVPDSSAPGPEALQAPPADSPVAPGEAPQAEEVLSPGPAPDEC